MDKLIRELLINVKQQGAAKTTKAIEGIVDALQDAASGAELANEQLAKMSPTLATIEKNAKKTAGALANMGSTKNLDRISKSLDSIEEYLDELLTTSTVASEKMTSGFNTVANAVNKMGNSIAGTVERTEDQLIGLNSAVGKTGKGFSDTTTAATKATRAVGDTSGAARGATRDFAALAKIGGGLPIMYAAIASNVFVLQSAFEQLKLGDQLNRLDKFGTIIGSLSGTPVQTLAASLQEAVGYAISFEEAMRQASSASAYGFNAKQLEQFGLVARRAAAVLGVDMTDALNRVIKGVSKQEIELLDELGVTIRLNDAYAQYVKQLNAAGNGIQYNVNSLSTFQKQQAYANAVIAESTKRFGQLDSVLRATPWEQFAANADAALRKIQRVSASVLEPLIQRINTIFYQSKAAQGLVEAQAQEASNRAVDPKNTEAVINSLVSSTDGYNAALARNQEALKKQKELQDQVNKAKDQYGIAGNVLSGMGSLIGVAPTEGLKKLQGLQDQLSMVNTEVQDSTAELGKWNDAVNLAASTAEKASPGIKNALNLSISGEAGASYDFNEQTLKSLGEQTKAYEQQKKIAADTATEIAGLTLNSQSAAKTSADLATNIELVNNYAKSTGQSVDTLTKNLGLGYNTMSDMVKAQKSLNNLANLNKNEAQDELAVQQKISEVYSQTRDKEKAQAAGRALEVDQINKRLSILKEAQKTGIAEKSIQDEIYKLETKKLTVTNQSMEATKKIKDVSDKIVGIEDQIALIKDSTLNSDEYSLATMRLQLKIEQDRQKILAGNAQKQRDYMQSKLQEAQIERSIRETLYSQADAYSKRTRDQAAAMRDARTDYTDIESMANKRRDLEQEIADIIKNSAAANVAIDNNRVIGLENEIEVLNAQLAKAQEAQNRSFQDNTTGLLGGSYSSTLGMGEGMKTMTEYMNNQQGYAEAISNLQAINSEATAAAQSLGNMVNAMMQWSQGSLDTTSAVAAGMQLISSAIQYSTSQQISSIDAAIAAEQARDGSSEESKAKIKKLEAEKVKVQQESAKKQILIQTAVAVMQAATSVPYPWSIPLMIAAAAAGALSYAQASSATPQLDGMSSGTNTASLTLGERDNSVDVSRNAGGGELSYIRGETGVGNANNFIPRAEGGNMIPGVGYIAGENGVEVITPSVPSKATPASEMGSGSSAGRPIILQISTMDSKSFMDFATENSTAFKNAVEVALNENGTSLDKLR